MSRACKANRVVAATFVAAILLAGGSSRAATVPSSSSWTLPDAAGRPHSLHGLQGSPHLMFFFCGCAPCHACARLWAQAQRGGELFGAKTPTPTVVIFLGNAPGARAFVAETGLDPSQTLILNDPMDRVSRSYGVIQCPRVFVLDTHTRLAYTNSEAGPPLTAPALVSRTLTAWRRLTPPRSGTTP